MTWKTVPLGSVLPLKYGKNLPQHSRTHTGEYPVFSSAGLIDTHNQPLTSGPTVIIGRKGSIGTVYLSSKPAFPIDTTFYVEESQEINIRYAYYLLSSLPLRQMNNDSAVPGLNRAQAETLMVNLPPLHEQQAIAATLGALDDKIESNRRITKCIPELIRAKVEKNLQDKSSRITIASLAKFVNGGLYTRNASGQGRMVIRIADLNSGPGPSTVYNELDVPREKVAKPGDILMSWSGSLGIYRWFREEAIINQHIFKVIPYHYPDWLVFDRLESALDTFREIAKDKATTMGHIQRKHLELTMVQIPAKAKLNALNNELQPLWKRLLLAERESLKLTRLRDTLLPELISGRIRVPEARKEMELVA